MYFINSKFETLENWYGSIMDLYTISVTPFKMEEICCGCGNVHPDCKSSDCSTCLFSAHAGVSS